MKKRVLIFIIPMLFFLIPITTQAQVELVTIDIQQAYYTDLDGDGDDFDVFAYVELTFSDTELKSFDYFVRLTLPSGKAYDYWYIIITNKPTLGINNNFIDHATESGWYKIEVLISYHLVDYTNYESKIFDPPGGSSGGGPIFNLQIV